MAQSIQVPLDLLQDFLRSIQDLKDETRNLIDEVKQLRDENATSAARVQNFQEKMHELRTEVTIFSGQQESQNHSQYSWPSKISFTHGQVFTLFPKLPVEIRNMIWKAAAESPRVVRVRLHTIEDDCEHPIPVAAPMALFFVNKESRSQVLKIRVCLSLCRRLPTPNLFLNCQRDTIWFINLGRFRANTFLGSYCEEIFYKGIEMPKVAICCKLWHSFLYDDEDFHADLSQLVAIFYGLRTKEILFVVNNPESVQDDDLMLITPRDRARSFFPSCDWVQALYNEEVGISQMEYGNISWYDFESSANAYFDMKIKTYLAEMNITADSIDEGLFANTAYVEYAKGTWKMPEIRYKEAVTRRELQNPWMYPRKGDI